MNGWLHNIQELVKNLKEDHDFKTVWQEQVLAKDAPFVQLDENLSKDDQKKELKELVDKIIAGAIENQFGPEIKQRFIGTVHLACARLHSTPSSNKDYQIAVEQFEAVFNPLATKLGVDKNEFATHAVNQALFSTKKTVAEAENWILLASQSKPNFGNAVRLCIRRERIRDDQNRHMFLPDLRSTPMMHIGSEFQESLANAWEYCNKNNWLKEEYNYYWWFEETGKINTINGRSGEAAIAITLRALSQEKAIKLQGSIAISARLPQNHIAKLDSVDGVDSKMESLEKRGITRVLLERESAKVLTTSNKDNFSVVVVDTFEQAWSHYTGVVDAHDLYIEINRENSINRLAKLFIPKRFFNNETGLKSLLVPRRVKCEPNSKGSVKNGEGVSSHEIENDNVFTDQSQKTKSRHTNDSVRPLDQAWAAHWTKDTLNPLILLADPGYGKSFLMTHIFLELLDPKIDSALAVGQLKGRLPVYLNCRDLGYAINPSNTPWDAIMSMQEIMYGEISRGIDKDTFTRWFSDCIKNPKRMVLLIDGWDESKPEHSKKLVGWIKRRISEGCAVVLSSRPNGFDSELRVAYQYELSEWRVQAYDEKEFAEFAKRRFGSGQEQLKKLFDIIAARPRLQQLVRVPLFATLICWLYENDSEEEFLKSTVNADLIKRVLELMLNKCSRDNVPNRGMGNEQNSLLQFVAHMVYKSYTGAGEPWVSNTSIYEKTLEEMQLTLQEDIGTLLLGRYGLFTRTEDDRFEIIHQTFVPWLAAFHVSEEFGKDVEKFKNWLSQHGGIRFLDPHWNELWCNLAGLLKSRPSGDILIEEIWKIRIRPKPDKSVLLAPTDTVSQEALWLCGECIAARGQVDEQHVKIINSVVNSGMLYDLDHINNCIVNLGVNALPFLNDVLAKAISNRPHHFKHFGYEHTPTIKLVLRALSLIRKIGLENESILTSLCDLLDFHDRDILIATCEAIQSISKHAGKMPAQVKRNITDKLITLQMNSVREVVEAVCKAIIAIGGQITSSDEFQDHRQAGIIKQATMMAKLDAIQPDQHVLQSALTHHGWSVHNQAVKIIFEQSPPDFDLLQSAINTCYKSDAIVAAELMVANYKNRIPDTDKLLEIIKQSSNNDSLPSRREAILILAALGSQSNNNVKQTLIELLFNKAKSLCYEAAIAIIKIGAMKLLVEEFLKIDVITDMSTLYHFHLDEHHQSLFASALRGSSHESRLPEPPDIETPTPPDIETPRQTMIQLAHSGPPHELPLPQPPSFSKQNRIPIRNIGEILHAFQFHFHLSNGEVPSDLASKIVQLFLHRNFDVFDFRLLVSGIVPNDQMIDELIAALPRFCHSGDHHARIVIIKILSNATSRQLDICNALFIQLAVEPYYPVGPETAKALLRINTESPPDQIDTMVDIICNGSCDYSTRYLIAKLVGRMPGSATHINQWLASKDNRLQLLAIVAIRELKGAHSGFLKQLCSLLVEGNSLVQDIAITLQTLPSAPCEILPSLRQALLNSFTFNDKECQETLAQTLAMLDHDALPILAENSLKFSEPNPFDVALYHLQIETRHVQLRGHDKPFKLPKSSLSVPVSNFVDHQKKFAASSYLFVQARKLLRRWFG